MKFEIRNLEKKFWPQTLLELPKSQIPKQLRIRGQDPDWSQKRICVIGSRKFSDYGQAVCQEIISKLNNYPITIVSGLAYGIDSLAHRFALENHMRTISIPGSGLADDFIYPKRHFDLAHKIMESGNCLISEFDDNQEAQHWTFPQRNRIMAGISDLVLIIEAAEKSGTMITARLALDYNIDVACVPGSIFNENSKGTNKLLKQGAILVSGVEDILEILKIEQDTSISKMLEEENSNLRQRLNQKEIEILKLLKNPLTKEQLLMKTKLNIGELNQALSILEINDFIRFLENKICQK